MDENLAVEIENEVDLFRETPIRYLGYSNEVGEAFRIQIGKNWVRASYGIAIGYVLADTCHKTYVAHQNHVIEDFTKPSRAKTSIIAAMDTLIWQMLASVIIPGVTINRVCYFSNYLLKKSKFLNNTNRKWLVISIGLATIPVIIKPIDKFVDELMLNTFKKWTKS